MTKKIKESLRVKYMTKVTLRFLKEKSYFGTIINLDRKYHMLRAYVEALRCHKYDEEWRMITGCIMKPPVVMKWIPSGIILGLRMDVAEENLVVSMAKEAGIKNIYKSYINAQNKLDAYLLKL